LSPTSSAQIAARPFNGDYTFIDAISGVLERHHEEFMKYRLLPITATMAFLLTACSFTLASDITPPPDYVAPTAMPTLGALVPPATPNPQAGAALFQQHCAACHGERGLGDGPQSMQLPVTVPGIGLVDEARKASPAAWFKMVTQGNLDRFMPPFVGALSEQQRWDVVAYALSLHTKPADITAGKQLFEASCADCAARFKDEARMAALSEDDIIGLMRNGEGALPAFGKDYTDEQAHAVADYIRTLTFATGPELAAAATASTAEAGSATAVSAAPVTPDATPAAGTGTITGAVQMGAGGALPANLSVTLHGFDHGQDQTTGPQEVLTLSTTAAPDGSFTFENVAMPLNRIFLAEVEYAGLKYRSDFDTAQGNSTSVALPPVKLYEKSDDFGLLSLNQVHIYTDFASAGTVQVLEIYAFSNHSDRAVVISTDGSTIPFIKQPENAENVGYEAGQDSAPFIAADKGLAVVPSDTAYSIIAFFTMPFDGKLELSQPFAVDAASIVLLVPDGMKVASDRLADKGLQVIQNNTYHEFTASDVKTGETLSLSISGKPRTSSATGLDARQLTVIGGGSLGVLLIAAGVFLYLRDRKRKAPAEDAGYQTPEEVMDAILALDDLHRAGKITEQAYQKRRSELKDALKNLA
jgi:mono/diheme cytochrome c family protein